MDNMLYEKRILKTSSGNKGIINPLIHICVDFKREEGAAKTSEVVNGSALNNHINEI